MLYTPPNFRVYAQHNALWTKTRAMWVFMHGICQILEFPYLRTLSCAQSRKLGGVDENLHSERKNLEWVKFKNQSKHFQFKS